MKKSSARIIWLSGADSHKPCCNQDMLQPMHQHIPHPSHAPNAQRQHPLTLTLTAVSPGSRPPTRAPRPRPDHPLPVCPRARLRLRRPPARAAPATLPLPAPAGTTPFGGVRCHLRGCRHEADALWSSCTHACAISSAWRSGWWAAGNHAGALVASACVDSTGFHALWMRAMIPTACHAGVAQLQAWQTQEQGGSHGCMTDSCTRARRHNGSAPHSTPGLWRHARDARQTAMQGV